MCTRIPSYKIANVALLIVFLTFIIRSIARQEPLGLDQVRVLVGVGHPTRWAAWYIAVYPWFINLTQPKHVEFTGKATVELCGRLIIPKPFLLAGMVRTDHVKLTTSHLRSFMGNIYMCARNGDACVFGRHVCFHLKPESKGIAPQGRRSKGDSLCNTSARSVHMKPLHWSLLLVFESFRRQPTTCPART